MEVYGGLIVYEERPNGREGVRGRITLSVKIMCRSWWVGKNCVRLFWGATLLSYPYTHNGRVTVMVCLKDCVRQSLCVKSSVMGVVWCCGWRVEVMELCAFCQPLTFISKPSFAFLHFFLLQCHSWLMSSTCLWPFSRDRYGFSVRSPLWLLKESYTVYCVCALYICLNLNGFNVYISMHLSTCVCVVRANLSATQCHRAIIPTLAQWPRLNPGFDPPPNLSLQALGWGWVLDSACQLDSACFFPASLVCLLPCCPPTEELAIEISFRVA